MSAFGAAAGGAAVGGAVQGGFGILNSYLSNKWAEEREGKARLENYRLNERAAVNADMRTRSLYEDLYGPQAQLEQIKAAGLSPSVFYEGGGGVSGQAGAQGAGATGISPNSFGISPIDTAALVKAFSEAKLNNAQSNAIEEKTPAEVSKLLADAGYADAATKAKEWEAKNMELDNYVKEKTKDSSVYQICELADKAGYEAERTLTELKRANVQLNFDNDTYNKRVEEQRLRVNQIAQSISESKSAERLNNQQKQYLRNEVLKSFDEIAIEWKNTDIAERNVAKYEEWINAKIPMLEKDLNVKLQELDIEKKKIVIDAIKSTIQAALIGATIKSGSSGLGQGNLTPPMPKGNMKRGGNALNPNFDTKYHSGSIYGF